MKLCILSGTFNPIHNGHLLMGEYILENYDIEKVIYIPAFIPPQKNADPEMTSHRLNMVKLAVQEHQKFEVSDIEYQLGGKSYTYLTVQELYKQFNPDEKINFVIGTDAFANLDSWYESEKLRKIIDFIVFVRENNFDKNNYNEMKKKGYNFKFANMEFHDISSTEIRELIKRNKPVDKLIPQSVERYIKENGLYKN